MLNRKFLIRHMLTLCAGALASLAHASDPQSCESRLTPVRLNPRLLRQIDFPASAVAPKFHVDSGGQVRLASLDATGNLAIFSLDNLDVIFKPPGNLNFSSFSWGTRQAPFDPIYAAREDGHLIKFHEGQMSEEPLDAGDLQNIERKGVHTQFLLNYDLWLLQKMAGISRVRIMPVGKYGEGWDVATDSTTFTTYPFMSGDERLLLGLKDDQSLQVFDVKLKQLILKTHLDSPTQDPVWIENGTDPLFAYVSDSRNLNVLAPMRPQIRVNTIKLRNLKPQSLDATVLHDGRVLLVASTESSRASEIFELKDNQLLRIAERPEPNRLERSKRALFPLRCGGSAMVTFERGELGGEDIVRIGDPERDRVLDFTLNFPDAQTVSGFDWVELGDCRALLAIQSEKGIRILQITEPLTTSK